MIWPTKKVITFAEAKNIQRKYSEIPFETDKAKALWRSCGDAFMATPCEGNYTMSTMVISHSLKAWRSPTINEYYGGTLNEC